ncbi:MAG TPA: branched-chain alpha-keto acid dehydrogenase subunit E2 [Paenibacillaceae bacterium]|nr:branched-chain alpha-keto acid dehydrogenase subunit E2 [Paenibacillaceae bacterium]
MEMKMTMPKLGESVTEGTLIRWLVKPGDRVKKYEAICEITTDKVNAEVPSTYDGKVKELVVQEGETVAVGELICYLETMEATEQPQKKRYSPAVLQLAAEHGLDLDEIPGTGMDGRITRKDVLSFLQERDEKQRQEPMPSHLPIAPVQEEPQHDFNFEMGIPVDPIRHLIAERTLKSKTEIPHAWTMVEVDMTGLFRLREKLKKEFHKKEGFSLTFLPFYLKAVVESIKKYPLINSVWEGDRIVIHKGIHISVAMATDEALYVPVLKDADQKSIFGLAKELNVLKEKTIHKKFQPGDMSGGTITINNTGSFGSILSMPIINQHQSVNLTLEAIVKRPVVINDMIAIRHMANLCLSLDHRVLDGKICGLFLQHLKMTLENFNEETTIY